MRARVLLICLGTALAIGVAGGASEATLPGDAAEGTGGSSEVRSFACPSEGSLADEMTNIGGVRGAGDCPSFGPC